MPASSIVQRGLAVGTAPRRPGVRATARARRVGERKARHRQLFDLLQRRRRSRSSTAPSRCCTRSSSARAIEAFDATLEDRSVLRDGGMGHRAQPLGQSVRAGHPPAGAAAAGARRRRARARRSGRRPSASAAYVEAVSQLYADFETIGSARRACSRTATRWRGSPRRTRTTPRPRSSTRCRSPPPRRRPTRPTPTSSRPARSSKSSSRASRIIRASRTTSSTATTCRRWPIARSTRRGATRRSRRRRRTRCTCRRTPSRASATGRSRSTPTSRPADVAKRDSVDRRRAARDGLPGLRLPADRRRTRSARQLLDALPEVAGALRSRARSARRRPGRPASSRWPRFRRATRSSAAPGPTPRSSSRSRASFLYTEALTYFARALGAARIGDTGDRARVDRRAAERSSEQLADAEGSLLGRAGRDSAARRVGVAGVRRRTRARTRSPRCAPPPRCEDATEKAAVTPGPLAPARELLGEMLLQMKQPADALKEFEATLKKEPNRFRALYGAAQRGVARRRSARRRARYYASAAEDLRARRQARAPRARRGATRVGETLNVERDRDGNVSAWPPPCHCSLCRRAAGQRSTTWWPVSEPLEVELQHQLDHSRRADGVGDHAKGVRGREMSRAGGPKLG